MTCKFFAALLWVALPFSKVNSQDSSRVFTLAMRPFRSLVGGFRLDVEQRIAKSNHWLQVGGELYLKNISRNGRGNRDRSWNSIKYEGQGYGVSLLYKNYLHPRHKDRGFYFLAGPTFESYRFTYQDYAWIKFEEDGLMKYSEQLVPLQDKLMNFSFSTAIGYQHYIFKYVFIDFYFGLGIRKSIFKSDIPNKENPFATRFLDFGITSSFPVLAIRVGVLLF